MSLKNILNYIGEKSGFAKTKDEALAANECVNCCCKITGFKDTVSKREYAITGMCQTCQDTMYNYLEDLEEEEPDTEEMSKE